MLKFHYMAILFLLLGAVAFGQEKNPEQQLPDTTGKVVLDTLHSITVTADVNRKNTVYRITGNDFKVTVAPLGESDAIKYIQTLPGSVITGIILWIRKYGFLVHILFCRVGERSLPQIILPNIIIPLKGFLQGGLWI